MKTSSIIFIATLLISGAWTVETQAQLARTFVSTTGNDANTCDRDAPCRNFNEAISRTAAGGEVTALDSGSYGHITVRKSLTVQGAPGAAVMVSRLTKAPVVFVELETTMKVVLRNLQISKPQGNGPNKGIDFRSDGSLHVENCIISGFDFDATDRGIHVSFPSPPPFVAKLFLKDTVIRGNAVGIYLAGSVKASLENCRIENNGVQGLLANSISRTTIGNSLVAGNFEGIAINDGATAYVETCTVTNNGIGINVRDTESPGAGIVYVSNTGFFGNIVGLSSPGISYSFGNNRFDDNTGVLFTDTLSRK
jgi:hypothetical protein